MYNTENAEVLFIKITHELELPMKKKSHAVQKKQNNQYYT